MSDVDMEDEEETTCGDKCKALCTGPGCLPSLRALFLDEWYISIFLLLVPVAIVLGAIPIKSPTAIFILNFLAIVPLAKTLGDCTEELALVTGQSIGGLLNATFGNAVELILSIIACSHGLIYVTQSSLLGSILSNILLVLGMCFVAGGIKYSTQSFSLLAAGTGGNILLVAAFAVLVPSALRAQLSNLLLLPNVTLGMDLLSYENATITLEEAYTQQEAIANKTLLEVSRGTAIVLIFLYGTYLTFQLFTHKKLFEEAEGSEEEEAKMHPAIALFTLVGVTVLVGVCSEYLVGSIKGIIAATGITETFTGLILLPIVGNAAEHLTAVRVAYKNKMDLAIGVAIGSSVQIALFVTPVLVIIGWIIGQPMSLYFQPFQTVVMFMSVLVVYAVINDGSSNWIEGVMLMGIYLIISIACFVLN